MILLIREFMIKGALMYYIFKANNSTLPHMH